MALSFSFELDVDTEKYERDGRFRMKGCSCYDHREYGETDCYAGMKLTDYITVTEIMRSSDGMPIGLRLSCDEADKGQDPKILEREMGMGDELHVSNNNSAANYHCRLRLKRTLQYEESMKDALIWVDEKDNERGFGEKLATHRSRILHRAFSVFIYNWKDGKMLLQCRADEKYHSGGLWCNACCSHPRPGETMAQTINKRLHEELNLVSGLTIADPDFSGRETDVNHTLYACGTFTYHADFGDLGEDELDHVFLLFTDRNDISESKTIQYAPDEIKMIRWMRLHDIEADYTRHPDAYSAWFMPAYQLALKRIKEQASCRGIELYD